MTQANYTLVASGGLTVPQIDINIWCDTEFSAKEQASSVAEALGGSGYFEFRLYATPSDGPHRIIGSVRLERTVSAVFVHAGENR